MTNLSDKLKKDIQYGLLKWFDEEKREMPWRETRNPYKIWVSEIMLQQTQIITVIPYFERFIEAFPTVQDLAAAPEEKVLKCWEGLGYYSRARNLHRAAKQIVAEFDGRMPQDWDDLLSLPGIGSYTAGAVLSIAFGQVLPAVDGNVLRVLSRMFLISKPINVAKTKKEMEALAGCLIPIARAGDFNQALMELGALICTPKSPQCFRCPLQKCCCANQEQCQASLPVKEKKAPKRELKMVFGVIYNEKGDVLIEQRPSKGLLANLWQFPGGEWHSGSEAHEVLRDIIKEKYQLDIIVDGDQIALKHIFTHLVWKVTAFTTCSVQGGCAVLSKGGTARWVKWQDLKDYPFPKVHQTIIMKVEGRKDDQ